MDLGRIFRKKSSRDIAKVISKYMKIDAQSMEIQITKTGVKGRGKTQSLYASIPILDLNK